MGDKTVQNFGIAIAICGALFVFGGQTFAIWIFSIDAEVGDVKTNLAYSFSADEINFKFERLFRPEKFYCIEGRENTSNNN